MGDYYQEIVIFSVRLNKHLLFCFVLFFLVFLLALAANYEETEETNR